ncbi:MAG: bifunctional transaldolase/phosoglucose isomerase [Chloroflexi bacterium]|nr:MAG: bifunctional transaldolase/phosoglucose isomerase [Chloroflexota bacterium]
MTKMHELAVTGQSIWLDYIRRAFLDAGKLNDLVNKGLRGVTSNPSIFQQAITSSTDYNAAIERLVSEGLTVNDIYETLAIQDIRRAADILRPVYERTDALDGYVSLEVNPKLAYDTEGTVMEARRLFSMVDRPNVMIKVPATPQGIPAIETLIGEGINVNVTLMFSMKHYDETANAYISGLERLASSNVDYSRVASVASFFVSRVDAVTDKKVVALGHPELEGKIAIANARMAYDRFKATFSGPRWQKLAAKGARVQRPLWGSTSTKNPAFPDTLYVDELIGPHTVNTLPLNTLDAFLDHGTVARTVDADPAADRSSLAALAELGIDLDAITEQLQRDGVKSFADAFDVLMQSIADKAASFSGSSSHSLGQRVRLHLGDQQAGVDAALAQMDKSQLVARIWANSYTVWKPQPEEISNRLGWLRIAEAMKRESECIDGLVQDFQNEGYKQAIVLGMGGSSLAPEVFGRSFRGTEIGLTILDSTHPDEVAAVAQGLDPAATLFIVSTKSGTTAETDSFFKYFYNLTVEAVGAEQAGQHFVAITDPGSKLVALAEAYSFRAIYINDPGIGGRYSALSHFGLVPASLVGVDLTRLLRRATEAMNSCGSHVNASQNPAAIIGAVLGELAKAGRDKLTIIASPQIASFGDWLEQLVAESLGKEGKGILPVVGEAVGGPEVYGNDRLFVYLQCSDDESQNGAVHALREAGQPVIQLHFRDIYDLAEQFFVWEFAVAVAGERLGVNPFDQPNVESAKVQARKMLDAYTRTGKLPELIAALVDGNATLYGGIYGDVTATDLPAALRDFLDSARPGDYVAIQAYIQPSPAMAKALAGLQTAIRNRTKAAVTLGFGPRFLHSTGQLHKGDGGNGLFLQLVDEPTDDLPIPDTAGKPESSVTFGVLVASQSLGDRQALLDAGRRLLRIDLGSSPAGEVGRMAEAIRG